MTIHFTGIVRLIQLTLYDHSCWLVNSCGILRKYLVTFIIKYKKKNKSGGHKMPKAI